MNYLEPHQLEHAIHESQERGRATDALGEALLLIARGVVRRSRFRGYTFKDDLVSAGVVKALSVYQKYSGRRGDAFAWFTSVITNAMLRYVREEQRQHRLADRWGGAVHALAHL